MYFPQKLTHTDITRVDALCLGPADNQYHPHYAWSPDQVKRITGELPARLTRSEQARVWLSILFSPWRWAGDR